MNYLFTICGRAGSKGVKNKNLKDFLGAPLVYYTLAAIVLYKEKYGADDDIKVVLNTDSEELIKIATAQKQISIIIIRREAELGGDFVPKVSVIKDCLIRTENNFHCSFDMVIDLDITSPFRTVDDVKNAIDKKNVRSDTDVVYSVTTARRNPYFNMVKEENGYFVKAVASEYTTRQQAPVMFDMNASIYAYAPRALKEKQANRFFNDRADVIVMKDTAVLDIDSEEDFELMQVLGEYFKHNDLKFTEILNKVSNISNAKLHIEAI